jgi:hypothetical protein
VPKKENSQRATESSKRDKRPKTEENTIKAKRAFFPSNQLSYI